MILTIKNVVATLAVTSALAVTAFAQTGASNSAHRGPSKATRAFVVLPAQSLGDLERKLRPENKAEDLIGGEGMQTRVAVQHEKDHAPATGELHDASDDVYYVLEGAATLTLGGKLEAPREVEPGEWRGKIKTAVRMLRLRRAILLWCRAARRTSATLSAKIFP